MPPLTIRPATLADLDAILALENSVASAAHWTADQYRDRIQSQPASARFLVGESQPTQSPSPAHPTLLAFVCARIVADEWELENIVVASNYRRQGIASTLLRALIESWQTARASVLHLEVRESNFAARALYERHAFCETGRRRAYYANPPEDAILYSLTRER